VLGAPNLQNGMTVCMHTLIVGGLSVAAALQTWVSLALEEFHKRGVQDPELDPQTLVAMLWAVSRLVTSPIYAEGAQQVGGGWRGGSTAQSPGNFTHPCRQDTAGGLL
jgi:hypothetical protein